jgi:hypothetical protein
MTPPWFSPRLKNRWIIASSLLAELAACLIAVVLAGGGHGTYYAAKCLFPYTMTSTRFFGDITSPFIVLAAVQFPVYGVILALGNVRGELALVAIGIVVIHLVAAALAFAVSSSSFCP